MLEQPLDSSAFGKEGRRRWSSRRPGGRTGEARLFWGAEVTAEVLLATVCLPQPFPSVEIDCEPYWDGGYASNPLVQPLIVAGAPTEVILVPTDPRERPEPPHGAASVREPAAEIAFNTALRQELRTLATAQRLLAELPEPPPLATGLARLGEARLHLIGAEEELRALPDGSAMDARWDFLRRLRELGYGAAERWLGENLNAIGARPTLDLAPFTGPIPELRAEDGRPPRAAERRTAGRRPRVADRAPEAV